MSALVFVRDGRTLPYVPVTIASQQAIRRHVAKRRPYAIATYVALLEFANDDRTDRVAVTQRDIVQRVGASRTTVQAALVDLQTAGVLVVKERTHGASRVENEYVIVEPKPECATSDTPARDTGDPRPSGEQLTKEQLQEVGRGTLAREHVKISGKPVNAEHWQRTVSVLEAFNQLAGRNLRLLTSAGEPSEAAKRIYGRVRAYPDITLAKFEDIIRRTLASRWWGNDPPSIGVVFGPNVFEENITRPGIPKAAARGYDRHAAKAAREAEREEAARRVLAQRQQEIRA